LLRSCHTVALKHNGSLKALLVVNRSDPGLSLSDFLNGIKILVNDEAGLPWQILSLAVGQLCHSYEVEKIPLLIYPSNYTDGKGMTVEKRYNLWIMDILYGKDYGEYMMDNTRLKLRFLIPLFIKKYLRK
jgi:hypothetical protein